MNTPQQTPVTIHLQAPLFLSFPVIKILAVVWSCDARTAPPVVLSNWIQTTLSCTSFLSLATLMINESFHWPSANDTCPDFGHTISILSDESFWYRDHCTVTSPREPFALRTGNSSLVTCLERVTSTAPLSLYTKEKWKHKMHTAIQLWRWTHTVGKIKNRDILLFWSEVELKLLRNECAPKQASPTSKKYKPSVKLAGPK